MKRFKAVFPALLAVAYALVLGGCSPVSTGAVREDVSLTDETKELEVAGVKYSGPEYNIAILSFGNRAQSRYADVAVAATDMLRTIVKKSGLEPITLTKDELSEQDRLMSLQQSGALKTGVKSATEGFDPVDFRISGSVTSYAEVEESLDVLVGQSKTRIARVQVDYALVDVASGKTLVAESGLGEYKKTTRGVLGFGGKSTADPGLRDGALRDALTRAMTKMVAKLDSVPYQGSVLAKEGNIFLVKAGSRSKLPKGAIFTVFRPGDDLVDPDTKRVIGKRMKAIAELELTSHQDERISEARFVSGEEVREGDIVKVAK